MASEEKIVAKKIRKLKGEENFHRWQASLKDLLPTFDADYWPILTGSLEKAKETIAAERLEASLSITITDAEAEA